jgi:hypothetical protein
MYITEKSMLENPLPERRGNNRLRSIYADASVHLHRFFKAQDDWVGSSIDYVALRLVHERYRELSPNEVRKLVAAIGGRLQHCVRNDRLTALYF